MDVSDFSENDFGKRGFGEKDLAKLASSLGMSYEIGYDVSTLGENKSYTVRAWVRLKGLKSKRCAVFVSTGNAHVKRFTMEVALLYRKPFDSKEALLPEDDRRVKDEAAAYALKNILRGCSVKISKTRHVRIPQASSVEEFMLKSAVAGGNAA